MNGKNYKMYVHKCFEKLVFFKLNGKFYIYSELEIN
jgi:hypothetical protein